MQRGKKERSTDDVNFPRSYVTHLPHPQPLSLLIYTHIMASICSHISPLNLPPLLLSSPRLSFLSQFRWRAVTLQPLPTPPPPLRRLLTHSLHPHPLLLPLPPSSSALVPPARFSGGAAPKNVCQLPTFLPPTPPNSPPLIASSAPATSSSSYR